MGRGRSLALVQRRRCLERRHQRSAGSGSGVTLFRALARSVRLPGHLRLLARLVESPFGVTRRLIVVLAIGLLGRHLVAQAREDFRHGRIHDRHHADLLRSGRCDGGLQDGVGDLLWLDLRGGQLCLLVLVVPRVLGEGRVDRGRLDQSD